MSDTEFDHTPVRPEHLQPARYFAANYAGEHIAGTEFVIGAAFVSWGVGASDLFLGLIFGNLLAVLTWTLVCAPVAVETRLTLYAYLEKLAGPGFVRLYSVINGVLFCILAGSMITVSASAVRIPLGIAPQTTFVPNDARFVLVACAVGAVVVAVAVLGFKRLAQFAGVVTPWMIAMFLVGALFLYPALAIAGGVAEPLTVAGFWDVATHQIWVGDPASGFTAWHVGAFAWVANLAMHGGMSDMSLLRFAPRASYGLFSALGMFIGHFAAWIWAGVMGAGAALLLNTALTQLDAGEVAFQALGVAGVLAVIIAGWTTSNPTLYRAGLAFQALNKRWDRRVVTAIVGALTTAIACFPFVFTRLLDFVGLMGLILAPVGAVIITEHWIFPRIGLTRGWIEDQGRSFNWAALGAWIIGLGAAFALHQAGLHLFFLLIPGWIATTLAYIGLAALLGARRPASARAPAAPIPDASPVAPQPAPSRAPAPALWALRLLAAGSLVWCVALAGPVLAAAPDAYADALADAKARLPLPTALFLLAAAALTALRRSDPLPAPSDASGARPASPDGHAP